MFSQFSATMISGGIDMCTCFTLTNQDFYFGRNLDLDSSFGEQVIITPRNYPFHFLHQSDLKNHYALIGMATDIDGTPLYAEAANEKGLAMAGLQFSGNAIYFPAQDGKENIAPFEIIPWILGQCSKVKEARSLLENANIIDTPFRPNVPNSPLHWILADKNECIVIESVKDGLKIYEDPIGVLTNNPPFDFHVLNLQQYLNITKEYPDNRFSSDLDLKPYAVGMGAKGLPGDASSTSRFIQTAFLKHNLYTDGSQVDSVQQFFRVLQHVSMIKGSVMTEQQTMDYTLYSCCIDVTRGIYYYTTHENSQICKVDMASQNLEGNSPIIYPLQRQSMI